MNNAKLVITGDDMALKHHGIILWTSFKTKEGETRHNNEKATEKQQQHPRFRQTTWMNNIQDFYDVFTNIIQHKRHTN